MDTTDKTDTEPVKRPRGRPRRTEDIDWKVYMRTYYTTHYVPKDRTPDSPKLGRPITPEEKKLTFDMKAYQRAYRAKKKLLHLLN